MIDSFNRFNENVTIVSYTSRMIDNNIGIIEY